MNQGAPTEVVAVIPTYRPTRSLLDLIGLLEPQVQSIIISDDASPCTYDSVLRSIVSKPKTHVIRYSINAGIARGLNDGLEAAREANVSWLLTLDQDSSISASYVQALVESAGKRIALADDLGAIGAATIEDDAGTVTYPYTQTPHGPVTEEVIQTGSLWSVAALTQIGGFDENLGIDAVDAAACLRLRERDFFIAIEPEVAIRHSIGEARIVSFLGRSVMVTGHSPARRTSMLRNRLRLFPAEFRQSPRHAFRTLRRVVTNQTLGLVLESERGPKAVASLKGLLPGTHKDKH